MSVIEDFIRFVDRSVTPWHAARQVGDALAEADFSPLSEKERWVLERGKGYFVVRDDAAVCAFRMPKGTPQSAIVLASHLDSPCLKLKPSPELCRQNIAEFSTEVYGAPLLHTWLDRDLGLAGRVIVKNKGVLESRLVFFDDYPLVIPSLAYHLDRSIAENGLLLNRQEHLNPIVTIANAKTAKIEPLLKKHLSFDELLSFDLFVVPLEKASYLGDFIASARLDNLTSAYAGVYGLTHSKMRDHALQMAIFFDHEEIGSKSFLGAESFFLSQILERICLHQKIEREDYFRLIGRSQGVSMDLAHGLNPNFADRYDLENTPRLGGGVVVKSNAMKRYATSASTAAPLIELAREKSLPLQKSAFRSDIPSGTTIGSILEASAGIPNIDIGIAGWAMHSIRECISADDEIALCKLSALILDSYTESD